VASIGSMVIKAKDKVKKGKVPNTPYMLACTVIWE
jgi:hypothetical protein